MRLPSASSAVFRRNLAKTVSSPVREKSATERQYRPIKVASRESRVATSMTLGPSADGNLSTRRSLSLGLAVYRLALFRKAGDIQRRTKRESTSDSIEASWSESFLFLISDTARSPRRHRS